MDNKWTKKFQKKKEKLLDSKTLSSLTRRRRRHKVSLSLFSLCYIYIRARTKSASKKTKRDRAFTSFSEDDEEENIIIIPIVGFFPLVWCAIGSASSCVSNRAS